MRSQHGKEFRPGLACGGGLLPMPDRLLDLLLIDGDAAEQHMSLALDGVVIGRYQPGSRVDRAIVLAELPEQMADLQLPLRVDRALEGGGPFEPRERLPIVADLLPGPGNRRR